MAYAKDIAIVLRRLDYSETSQVLAVFTRAHGQQRLIAKGIKRAGKSRAATAIDLLELGQVVFTTRPDKSDRLGTLTEWRQEDNFPHLRRDLTCAYAAQYAAEVTAQLTEIHDPHPALFDGLRAMLTTLQEVPPLVGLDAFLWILLNEIGLRPELQQCVNCGRSVLQDSILYFSSRQGGAICRDCEPSTIEKRRITPALAHALGQGAPDARLARPMFELLDYHFTELMAARPRLSGPLHELLASPAKR